MRPLTLAWFFIVAGAACAAISLAGAVFVHLRRSIRADLLLEQIARLVRTDDRPRAVKLGCVVDTPATTLVLYALGLELPDQVFDDVNAGFRDAACTVPFAARLDGCMATATVTLARRQDVLLLFAGLGLLGSGGGAASWFVGQPALEWPVLPQVVAGAGILGAALALWSRARINSGLRLLRDGLPALLSPVEDLSSVARSAAATAREAHARSRFRVGSQPPP